MLSLTITLDIVNDVIDQLGNIDPNFDQQIRNHELTVIYRVISKQTCLKIASILFNSSYCIDFNIEYSNDNPPQEQL